MSSSPRSLPRLVAGLALLILAAFAADAAEPDLLATLRPEHPRLIANAAAWQALKARAGSDQQLAALVGSLEADARELLTQAPSTYHKTGRRLLGVSREVLRRTLVLGLAYRVTGNADYLRRAEKEMLAVSAFSDWNPSHFLDVGEMTAALALGYDWLYADLGEASRRTIREAIVAKGLKQALDPKLGHNSWQKGTNNWNQVCWGGMVLGCLAVGDEVPEIAKVLLGRARQQMPIGLKSYAPDGVYPEGPGYWSYGTSYSVMTFAAMQTAIGTDWELSRSPGFRQSAGAFLQMNGPSGLFFDYSDCGESGSFEPALFWFARAAGDPGLVSSALARLAPRADGKRHRSRGESSRFMPLTALWWPEQRADGAPSLPLRWHGDGPNPLVVFRSSWTDPRALYLAAKGGSAGLSHAHMDAGSFVFELNGVRWARDLGSQDYESLESKGVDLWNRRQNSQRWTVFRLNNRSHNTLTIDDQLHRVEGDARVVAFSDRPEAPGAVVELSSVLAGQVKQARRGFRVLGNEGILVQDELSGLKSGSDVCWTMMTAAQVEVGASGAEATLRDGGQRLTLRVLSPAGAKVSVISADPPADGYNAPNPNRRRVVIHVPAPADGEMILAVALAADAALKPPVEPLARWKLR